MQLGKDDIIIVKIQIPKIFSCRYIGYSYINCAWYAFPFEAMEVFTFFSLQVNFKRDTQVVKL